MAKPSAKASPPRLSWDVPSRKPLVIKKATRSATPIRPPTSPRLKPPKSLASASIWKPGREVGAAPKSKVVMGDGAEWIWNIADQYFPGAIQIVDLFHARQHLWDLARKLYPNQEAEQRRWMMIHQDLLDEGKIEDLVAALRSIDSASSELAEKIRIEAGYFENRSEEHTSELQSRQYLVCRLLL